MLMATMAGRGSRKLASADYRARLAREARQDARAPATNCARTFGDDLSLAPRPPRHAYADEAETLASDSHRPGEMVTRRTRAHSGPTSPSALPDGIGGASDIAARRAGVSQPGTSQRQDRDRRAQQVR